MTRAFRLVLVAVAMISAAVGAIAVGPGGSAHAAVLVTETFDTPGEHTWTVPDGVTVATFDVYGAAGAGGEDGHPATGLGARVSVETSVTPGETYTIVVGNKGTIDQTPTDFGGGAPGGSQFAGGGGGGSWVVAPFATDDLTGNSRLVVAGGGGGATSNGDGGHGGLEGADGGVDQFEFEDESGGGGTGGDDDANGGGGRRGTSTACTNLGEVGGDGNAELGGAGGDAGTRTDGEASVGGGGGGGGGGYFGGGGGGGAGSFTNTAGTCQEGDGGGGGGGSSFSHVAGASFGTGVHEGDGLVTISFLAAAETTLTLTASANPSKYGQDVTYTATVTSDGGGVPVGDVVFSLNGVDRFRVTLDDQGVAVSDVFHNLPKNEHVIGATFEPTDPSDFMPSSAGVTHVVDAADTTTSLAISPNPAVEGEPITFSVVVDPVAPGAGTPTGGVVLSGAGSDAGTSLSGGEASYTLDLPAGEYQVSARYRGNDDFFGFNASTSPVVTLVVRAAADLVVSKTLDGPVVAGGNAVYTLNARNDGPSAATNFEFRDLQPAGTRFAFLTEVTDAPDAIQCGIIATGPSCELDSLATGVPLTYRVGFEVDPFAVNGSTITNTLTALSDTFDPNTDNNTSTVTSTVIGCSRRITGHVPGNVNVAAGEFVCVDGATVGGGLVASNGARVAIRNSRFGGQVRVTSPSLFVMCNTQALSLDVRGATGNVHVGRPGFDCAGNTLRGSAVFDGNRGTTVIGGNTIAGQLVCYNNSPAPTNGLSTNTAASKAGQCIGL